MLIQSDTRINSLRQDRGLSQTDLAKIMSVTRSSVNAWEMGISVPTAAKLVELSLFFHVSTDYILGLDALPTVNVTGLTETDIQLVHQVVAHLRDKNRTE